MEEKETNPENPVKENKEAGEGAPLPADFSTFILSLSTSVLMHLGEIKNLVTENVEKDIALARHTIDIIEMFREKTRGNLTADEDRLIRDALYDLRMRYLRVVGQHPLLNR